MNIQTGEIKKWDDLTPEQQQSGEWIKLPPIEDAGPALAGPSGPGTLPEDLLQQMNRLNDLLPALPALRRESHRLAAIEQLRRSTPQEK